MVFNEFFTSVALPFLLVFVVIFAILQKSKILGDGKRQVDALASLAIALLLVVTPPVREIVVALMPWVAVGVAVILVFFILYGFVAGDLSTANAIPSWMKITFGVLAGVFTLGVVLVVTGLGNWILELFEGTGETGFWTNVLVIAVIIGAALAAVFGGGKGPRGEGGKDKEE